LQRDLVPTLLFDEVALQGRVSFVPALEGRASMEVVGFELLGVRGLAEEQGFEIGDGTLDARVKMRFQGQDGIAVDAKSTFTHLSLSEPSGGPISRYLSLPMPLDTVLFLTKNEADEHVVPVSVHLEEGQIGHGELLSAIMQATGVVLAEAVASAPLRLVTGVTSLFGVDLTGSAASDGDPTLSLEYAVGAVELSPAEHAKLAEFVRGLGANSSRVLAIEHAFGRGDLARADVLGNPPHEETRDLVDGLRTRKGSLVRQRDESSAAARVSAALGDRSELAAAQERMSALDRELAGVEDALDAALELERNGAERHRDGRARRAALEIGRARVSALREALLELGVGGARQEPRPVRLSGDLVLEKGTVRIVAHPRK